MVRVGQDSAARARFDPKATERVKLSLGENARWADISELGRERTFPAKMTATATEGGAELKLVSEA
jgi:hypothetical protein